MPKHTKAKIRTAPRARALLIGLLLLLIGGVATAALPAHNAAAADQKVTFGTPAGSYVCGSGKNAVKMSINIGCQGQACQSKNVDGCSAIVDAIFAIIRFLSIGVGFVVVGSLVWAGIQYTTSRGDPNATQRAIERVRNTVIALFIYIFSFAILNYVVPKGFFL